MPFAFVATILIVTTVMTLTAAVATGVLPDVGATRTPIADASALLMGAAGGLLISLGSVISTTGNNMGQLLSGSRSVYALAEHGDLPAVFARVHPGLPHALRGDLVHQPGARRRWRLAGSFVFLAAVSAVARLVIYLSTCLATLWMRRHEGAPGVTPATFTAPLGPVIPVAASAHLAEHPGRGHLAATAGRSGRAGGRRGALRHGAAPGLSESGTPPLDGVPDHAR